MAAKFGGFGGGGMNMQQMMKQAQKMQEQMAKAQEELEEAEVEGSASGMVTVTMNGKKVLQSISIKPEAVDPDDVEMLEDLIVAAYNDAYEKACELEKEIMPFAGQMGF